MVWEQKFQNSTTNCNKVTCQVWKACISNPQWSLKIYGNGLASCWGHMPCCYQRYVCMISDITIKSCLGGGGGGCKMSLDLELGHMLMLNRNRNPCMWSPAIPSDLTLADVHVQLNFWESSCSACKLICTADDLATLRTVKPYILYGNLFGISCHRVCFKIAVEDRTPFCSFTDLY